MIERGLIDPEEEEEEGNPLPSTPPLPSPFALHFSLHPYFSCNVFECCFFFAEEGAKEQEPEWEPYIPEQPSPVLQALYSDEDNKVWLSMGDFDAGSTSFHPASFQLSPS